MIQSVLVANRGEIARRVFRTCRELGIATVAVHSDADAGAAHAREADAAVRLPGDAPAETYLRDDLVVKAALAGGADAVHPGYGFLSENAGFARAVLDAGLTWIGPPPEAIEAMASKTRAKELMRRAGVPLLEAVDPERATADDLPLLIKAASGGGGRGMRVVRDLADLPGELAAASAEAASAFGDGEVFAEPYVERGRHVEVQVLADDHGTVWVLGTRDCSLQRRHQKVIEEAPAPGLSDALRATLHDAAAEAARAVGYRGAGTVEFLVSGERGHFLEMNTRLQVEHPVTELVHGVDLVALQLQVAEGERLDPEPPAPTGHAVEARLYAEDPARGWQPQTGVLHRLRLPETPHVRLDSGIADGGTVSVHYDPMLAKVIAWAPTREGAVRRLAHVLQCAELHGPVTNRDLLVRSLRHPDFTAGRRDTGFYDRHLAALTTPPDPQAEALSALAAALADAAACGEAGGLPARLGGWRNVRSAPQTRSYRGEPSGTVHDVAYHHTRDGLRTDDPAVRVVRASADAVTLETDGVARTFRITVHGVGVGVGAGGRGGPGAGGGRAGGAGGGRAGVDGGRGRAGGGGGRGVEPGRAHVHVDGPLGAFTFVPLPRFPDPTARTEPGSLLAPMPGTVVRVADVGVGDTVEAGQPLLWLEAMKMEHRITAPTSGTLTALDVTPGTQVDLGTLLAVVTPADQAAAGEAVAGDGPAGERPMEARPVGAHPVGAHPVEAHPVGELPAGEARGSERAVGEAAAGEAPAETTPTETTPTEAPPAGEAPAGEARGSHAGSAEAPAGTKPAETTPTGEASVGATPAEAPPAGEAPAGDR